MVAQATPPRKPRVLVQRDLLGRPVMIRKLDEDGHEQAYALFTHDAATNLALLWHVEVGHGGAADTIISRAKREFSTIIAAATNNSLDMMLRGNGFQLVSGPLSNNEPVLGWLREWEDGHEGGEEKATAE